VNVDVKLDYAQPEINSNCWQASIDDMSDHIKAIELVTKLASDWTELLENEGYL
jgi:hypothetical protein